MSFTKTLHHRNKNEDERCNCSVAEYANCHCLIFYQYLHVVLIVSREQSLSIIINKDVEKKKMLAEVTRRQPNSPASMILKNPNCSLVRISTRRTINQIDSKKPVIMNMHTKWSGSRTLGVASHSKPASPFSHNSSIWSSWSHSKFSQSSSKDLTVNPPWRIFLF